MFAVIFEVQPTKEQREAPQFFHDVARASRT